MKALIIILLLTISMGYSQNSAEINGCGPTSSSLISALSPNGPFPLSTTIFEESCNTHDLCYEPDGKAQASCDNDFLNNLLAACAIYSGFNKNYCQWYAKNMYAAVDSFGENSVELDLNRKQIGKILPQTLLVEIYDAGILGQEIKICGKVKNISKFNSHFKLYLFDAARREAGKLPENEFQLAWQPLLFKDYFRLRSGEEKDFCLDTGGIVGIARNINDVDLYRLELWVNSSRADVGLLLADFIEAKIAK